MPTPWPAHYRRNALHACAAVIALVFLAFAPFIVGPWSLMDAARDTTSVYPGGAVAGGALQAKKENDPGGTAWQSEAWLAIQQREQSQGHLAWWDPYDGYGKPFAAAQQPQPFFPLTLAAAQHPSPRVWNAYVAARLALAGVFAALFVLFFGGRLAAFAAGAATAFSSYFLLYYGMPHLSVEVLIPALLWASEWMVRRPGYAGAAATATITACAFLGGMPESQIVLMLTAGVYVVLRLLFEGRGLVRLLPWLGSVALGVALAAFSLFPLLEFLQRSFDIHRTAPDVVGFETDPMPPLRLLLNQLAPLAEGAPLGQLPITDNPAPQLQGGITIVPFFCALVAFAAALRGRLAPAARAATFALAAILAVFALKNVGFPLVQWIGALPALRLVIFQKYDEAAIASAGGLLCGLGIAAVQSQNVSRRAVAIAGALTLAALSAAYVFTVNKIPAGLDVGFVPTMLIALLMGAAACACALARRRGAAAALAAVAALGTIGGFYLPLYTHEALPLNSENPYAGAPYVRDLQQRTAARHERVLGLGGMLTPNWSGAFGLTAPTALDALYPSAYLPFINAFLNPRRLQPNGDFADRFTGIGGAPITSPLGLRWLTLSSVRYIAMPPDVRLAAPQLRQLHAASEVRTYTNDDVLPRASIFHRVRGAHDDAAALAQLTAPAFDVHATLVLSGEADASGTPASGSEHAELTAYDAERATIAAHLTQPGWVMFNDTNYPGWRAAVDGRAVPIVAADSLFRAVAVPAGTHTIVFAYAPQSVARGELLSGAALIVLLVLVLLAIVRARRSPARAEPA